MIRHALAALIIHYNPGGIVDDFAYHISHLGDRPVRIVGECDSACTMLLGAKNVCVTPDSRFMFHQAYVGSYAHAVPSPSGTALAASFWPWAVDRFVHYRLPAPPGELWVRGSSLIALGVKRCD